jgi:hypothetical protein
MPRILELLQLGIILSQIRINNKDNVILEYVYLYY